MSMTKRIKEYETLVFDCDGVVLDSNRVKTEAFFLAAEPFGLLPAQALVEHHTSNGGVSRYKKFAYFLEHIVPKFDVGDINLNYDDLLKCYASFVEQGLLSCDIAEGLERLRQQTTSNWLIVSGGDQNELRDIFTKRGIVDWFDGGIFGSPDTKEIILNREIANENISSNALFIGDSKYDYQASQSVGLDFVFLSGWSEVKDREHWARENSIDCYKCVNELL